MGIRRQPKLYEWDRNPYRHAHRRGSPTPRETSNRRTRPTHRHAWTRTRGSATNLAENTSIEEAIGVSSTVPRMTIVAPSPMSITPRTTKHPDPTSRPFEDQCGISMVELSLTGPWAATRGATSAAQPLPPPIAGSVPIGATPLLAQTSTALPVLHTAIDEGVSVRPKHTSPGAAPFEDQCLVSRVRSCCAIPSAITRGVLLTPLPPVATGVPVASAYPPSPSCHLRGGGRHHRGWGRGRVRRYPFPYFLDRRLLSPARLGSRHHSER